MPERLPGPSAPAPEGLTVSTVLRSVAMVGPPLTVGTALLFYFGWATTDAQSAAMGLDEAVFGMGTTDYVLRSLDALFVPVIVGSAALIAWSIFHARVLEDSDADPAGPTPATVRVAEHLWWLWLVALVPAVVLWPPGRPLTVPAGAAVAVLLLHYRFVVRLRMSRPQGADDRAAARRVLPSSRTVLVGILVTALLFWEVASYAQVVGRGRAASVTESVDSRPSVVVLSEQDLQLAPPVRTTVVGGEESRYRYRHEGLRLLQHTGGTWFLVPDGWRPGESPLVALHEDTGFRLEFTGPPR